MLSNLFCLFLQETLNRCGIGYFTDGGTQPLNYVTVMLLSLQFQQVVRFLGTQFESSDAQAQGDMQMHGAHMGVAMLYHEVGLPSANSVLSPGGICRCMHPPGSRHAAS